MDCLPAAAQPSVKRYAGIATGCGSSACPLMRPSSTLSNRCGIGWTITHWPTHRRKTCRAGPAGAAGVARSPTSPGRDDVLRVMRNLETHGKISCELLELEPQTMPAEAPEIKKKV